MAGQIVDVDMADDDLLPAWRTVIELADSGISRHWTLVGGLMVDAHARRASVVMPRPTEDVDVLVDYATNRSSLIEAQTALRKIGFELSDSERHGYRFMRSDGRKLDLMVADHLPSRMQPRLGGRPAFSVPAGEQAIRRRDTYRLNFSSGQTVWLGVPDELGALVAKGAAWLVDRRDRERHLDDGAVLFACVRDASGLDYAGMSKNDRKRISALISHLSEASHSSWIGLDTVARERGLLSLMLIRQALDLT
jgi:hypothetical protein